MLSHVEIDSQGRLTIVEEGGSTTTEIFDSMRDAYNYVKREYAGALIRYVSVPVKSRDIIYDS